VADNGCGAADRDLTHPGSLGVIGMRERSAILGGTLTVSRRRSRGTVVTVTVPLVDHPGHQRGQS
jgi:signal transduction histidine kinase